jgi:hypothetical protein
MPARFLSLYDDRRSQRTRSMHDLARAKHLTPSRPNGLCVSVRSEQ